MKYKFCPTCGSELTEIHAGDDGMVPYCVDCDQRWFDSFHSCAIVLVYNEFDEIALSRQSYLSDTYASFTAGYMTPGESAEETAIREVKEEIGLDLEKLEYAGTYWFDAKDMLMHGFIGFAHKKDLILSEEIDSAEWVPALDVPKSLFPDRPGNSAHAIYRKFLKMRNL